MPDRERSLKGMSDKRGAKVAPAAKAQDTVVPVRSGRAERQSRETRLLGIELAARHAFASNGFERTSMSEIAATVGVAEATIYKYYESKWHLLITVLHRWYREMLANHRAKIAGIPGTRQRIYALIWQHLKVIEDSPDLCRLFYAEVRSQAGYHDSELHTLNREVTGLFIEVLKEGIADGSIRPNLPFRLVRDLVFGGIEHHMSSYLAGRSTFDCDALAGELTNIVMGGVGMPAPAEAPGEATLRRLETVATRLETLAGRAGDQ